MYQFSEEDLREDSKLYDQIYLNMYNKHRLLKSHIPNHYFFQYLILSKSYNSENKLDKKILDKILISNIFNNAQIDNVNNCLIWDWPNLKSSGTIKFSSETFSIEEGLKPYNYFIIKGQIKNEPFEIHDYFTEINLSKMAMIRIREYREIEEKKEKYQIKEIRNVLPIQLQYISPILSEEYVKNNLKKY